MMNRFKSTLLAILLLAVALPAFAQQRVTVRELNTYDEPLTSLEDLLTHPLIDEEVEITVVLTSYPRSSGLRSYNEDDNSIGSILSFAIDTSAVSQGFEGMAINLNDESLLLEERNIGDIITITGTFGFRFSNARLNISEVSAPIGNVNEPEFERYQSLIQPIEIDLSEIIIEDDGTYSINMSGYTKWVGQYVKISNSDLSFTAGGDRPDWAARKNGLKINTYDQSLRFRNDRNYPAGYRAGFNMRRLESDGGKGEFLPVAGAKINLSGFLVHNGGNDIDDDYLDDAEPFSIAPMEDGTVWIGDNRFDASESFPWPNDLEYIGFPPLISSNEASPEIPTSSDQYTISYEISTQSEGETIDSVVVTFTDIRDGELKSSKIQLTNDNGITYSASLPAQPNWTPVSYFIEAYTSSGLVGRFPATGTDSYFVYDSPINSIQNIQTTGGQIDNASPLIGLGDNITIEIEAIIVSDALEDGILIAQENQEGEIKAFSGIFLSVNPQTADLEKGDLVRLNITASDVLEAEVADNSNTYTYLDIPPGGLTVISKENDISPYIPVMSTDRFNEEIVPGEAWEGMLVSLENVQVTGVGSFGEFTVTTVGDTSGVILNEDTRSGIVGETGFPSWVNEVIRQDVTFSSVTAIGTRSFGPAKLIPRGPQDFVGVENFTKPRPNFNLLSPDNNISVNIEGDGAQIVDIEWNSTTDYDGDNVTYEWVVTTPDDTDFENIIFSSPSNGNGSNTVLSVTYSGLDEIMNNAGVDVGASVDLIWSVRASDALGDGFVATTRDFGFAGNYRSFDISLTRGTVTSLDEELPIEFALEQNYPNPFNPATTINFALPQSNMVNLVVYNMLGQQVATVINQPMEAGRHSINFDASNLSTGMYIYRLTAGEFSMTRKMTLIK